MQQYPDAACGSGVDIAGGQARQGQTMVVGP